MCTLNVDDNSNFLQNENSQLGVRAVMIKCEIPEEGFPSDETTRFQREELFKHNALQDCKQKLAMTIKMSSEPDQASGDEYIPIEHVLGVNRKRIRLLNPYVLRLRRKAPFQAYKLRRIDTVRGVIAKTFDKKSIRIGTNESKRIQRDLQSGRRDEDWSASIGFGSLFKLDRDDRGRHSYSFKIRDPKQPLHTITAKAKVASRNNYFDHDYLYPKINESSLSRRRKRHNIKDYEFNLGRWTPTEFSPQKLHQVYDKTIYKQPSHKINEEKSDAIIYEDNEPLLDAVHKSNDVNNDFVKDLVNNVTKKINLNGYKGEEVSRFVTSEIYRAKSNEMNNKLHKKNLEDGLQNKGAKKDFVIYEIGVPDLWYSAQVQLFEKLSTPEGKTLWNDLTKDESVSLNTANPEWSNQDVNFQYKPAEFLAREEFMLPLTDLRLVVPLKHDHENGFKGKTGEFVIVPVDDVVVLDDPKEINKRDENSSDFNTASPNEQRHRQVIVRTTRALMSGVTDSLKIVTRGSDRYLKLPHPKPHYTQMDLEASADDNELILVGVLGRLTTIVSDTTRRIRSILTVQATNTGLAAARMRVLTRECSPELFDSSNEREETVADPVILPPKHTKTFRLTVPLQNSVESANCTIVLVNDDDDSVAVRDVRIKRDDRCYCVWHCDCVCLAEDPKLLCRDMTSAQLLAAGLSPDQKTRHARSVCYPDVVTLNLFVTIVGVLLALLNLGIMKAFVGLICRCVGSWGLQLLVQTPRKLDHYYECSLRNRRVVYDAEGWPVHPDTKERTVRLVSKSMEFILNVIFFITLPCVMIWDSMKKLVTRCLGADENSDTISKMNDSKKCFNSSHDVQVTERRLRNRRGLRKWMTPQAEELTTDLWHEGLTPVGKNTLNCLQRLLQDETSFRKTCEQSSFVDSEQDDTEYVLMQMQKSRESLSRSQRQEKTKITPMN
nr:uncharacterized protein LOC117981997 [Maniola hyperantus]